MGLPPPFSIEIRASGRGDLPPWPKGGPRWPQEGPNQHLVKSVRKLVPRIVKDGKYELSKITEKQTHAFQIYLKVWGAEGHQISLKYTPRALYKKNARGHKTLTISYIPYLFGK